MTDRRERLAAIAASLQERADMLYTLDREIQGREGQGWARVAAWAAEDAVKSCARAAEAIAREEDYPDATCIAHEGPVADCGCEAGR